MSERERVKLGLLTGELTLPNPEIFADKFGEDNLHLIERFFNALWNKYLLDGEGKVNTTFWYKQFNNRSLFNEVLRFMSRNKWVISDVYPARNWADVRINEDKLLSFVTPQELADTRAVKKYRKYKMGAKLSERADLVRVNGKTTQTGLVREGFTKASNTQFFYDSSKLSEYLVPIAQNTVKGMQKVRQKYPEMGSDSASYDVVAMEIVNSIASQPAMYNMLGNKSDSRGRAIKGALSKVANPIGYKDFRALIVIPEHARGIATFRGCYAIYLFIAELVGYKEGPNPAHKAKFGRQCYLERTLPQLDLDLEEDRKHLHELIWLERLYAELDSYFRYNTIKVLSAELGEPAPEPFKWSVPIELDASSSMLQYEGCLLNDDRLLRMTNVIGKELTDPWHVNGLPRNHVKKCMTPLLYGSLQPVTGLWKSAKLEYTHEQVALAHTELKTGAYSVPDAFKRFVIQHVNPSETMEVTIGKDKFTIQCNRFKNVAEKMYLYEVYDTRSDECLRFTHMDTHKVADLDAFKTYFVTLLIHNLDGQVADDVAGYIYDQYGFCIDIHDAFIVCPQSALPTRRRYAKNLTNIRTNRKSILNGYFASIGINATLEHKQAWDDLMVKVVPADESVKVSLMALK